MQTARGTRTGWLSHLLSTQPADRAQAESALRELYAASGLPSLDHFFWFDSPFAALWAVALLTGPHDFLWQRILDAFGRAKREREFMDRVRATMCQSAAQPDWQLLVTMAGEPMGVHQMRQGQAPAPPVKSSSAPSDHDAHGTPSKCDGRNPTLRPER